MTFIKLHHEVFELGLSPNGFKTYCAILRFMNTATGYANVSGHKLAATISLSARSIQRGVKELQGRRLVRVIKKRGRDGYWLANGYQVSCLRGRFTKLPLEALNLPLKATGFMVYAYLLKCVDKKKRAFPSLSGIAKGIGVSIPTIIEQIKELVAANLVEKNHYIKKDRSFGHNQYRLHEASRYRGGPKTAVNNKKERTHLLRMPSQVISIVILLSIIIICDNHVAVNELFVNIWNWVGSSSCFCCMVVRFCRNRYYTHLATRDNKKSRDLYAMVEAWKGELVA